MASQALFASPQPLSQSAANALSPAQSLAVVDIFINAALACICHTRELIPWDSACFRTRYIDDLHSDFWKNDFNRYSAFCDTEPFLRAGKSQEFRILKRGEDKRADCILDLIETGVFSAVDRGFLEAVRFFVAQGGTECHSLDVLESYTLNFTYDQGNLDSSSVPSVSFNSTHVFATDNTIKSFKRAIKSLLTSLQGLPSMPRKRSLGVAMLYNNRCPSTYETPGFLTEDVSLAAKEQTGWHKLLLQETGEVGAFEVGRYRVVVGASHIRPSIEVPTSSQVRDLNTRVQLQSWQKSSSRHENGLLSTLDAPGSKNPQRTPAVTNRLTSDLRSPFQSSQAVSISTVINGSQQSRVSGMTRKSRKRNVVPEKLAELIVQACALEAHRQGEHIFDLEDLQQQKITRLDASLGGVMRCGCGDESNNGDLLLCTLCGTSQHMECYGWNVFSRVRLPDEHFCYSCLLLPREAVLEAQMPTLIHKRLALAHIQENNPTNATDLMNAMHLSNTEEDHEIFNDIVDKLQQDGYLTRGGAAIMATMDKESAAIVFRDFVNPIAHISHHFIAIKDGENENTRARAIAAAVKEYTQGRAYLPHEDHIDYEQQTATDVCGGNSQRWGFYSTTKQYRKRKASTSAVEETPHKRTAHARKVIYREAASSIDTTTPPYPLVRTSVTRKVSRCETLACLDRSSPSTVLSMEGVLDESVRVAVSEVQWEAFASGGGRKQ